MNCHNSAVVTQQIPVHGKAKRRWHGLLRLMLVAGVLLPAVAQAQYHYSTNNNSITITGYSGAGGAVTITNTINNLLVTGIGDYAFYGTSLTSVMIPSSITNIGYQVFANCTVLTNITVETNSPAYSSLAGVLFNQSQTTLVAFPSGRHGSYPIPAGVTSIGDSAFWATSLTNVILSTNVVNIADEAFRFGALSSVAIPNSVTNIGARAFASAYNLTNITVDASNPAYSSVAGVFFNKSQTTLLQCPGGFLDSYTIPLSVTRVEDEAFLDCRYVTSLTIPNTTTNIGTTTFYNCYALTDVTIGNGVTSLGSQLFEYCFNLTNLTIGTGVTSIGYEAFSGCSGLSNLVIPTNVTSIGYATFDSCSGLTNVIIPASVTSLGSYAFEHCTNLTGVYFLGNAPGAGTDATVFTNVIHATGYYLAGAAGFGLTFDGLPTALWTGAPEAIIVVTVNPANAGSVTGGGTYPVGTNVQISATANSGWSFIGWSDSNPNAARLIAVPAGGTTATANFTVCTYAFAAVSTNVAAGAGSGSVDVTSPTGCGWTAVSATNWIQTTSSGTGNGTVNFTFDANPAGLPRSGTISINGQTYTVSQAAATCTYTFATVSTNVAASGGSASAGVVAPVGCAWTVTNDVSWIIITSGSSGTGNGTVRFAVTNNSINCTNRSGTLTLEGQTFTVTQPAGNGNYSLSTASTNVAAAAGSGSVSLTAGLGCAWTASSDTNWIHTASSGTGSGTLNYTFDANPGGTSRSGTLTVQSHSFTITQLGATATISVQASPANAGTVTGAGTYAVGTNIQITATATSGWRFTGWNDSNTNSQRTVSAPLGGATYTANFVIVVSLAPPVIVSPPIITNALLVVSNRFVIVAGETNVFTVGALDTVDNSFLRYQWQFGDGGTSAWSAVALATHSYATNHCGPYTASVTVSNTQAAISSNLSVSAACLLTITKLQLGVSFSKTNADSCALTAKLALPGVTNLIQLTSATVLVDVGHAQVPFTLDNKGRGVSPFGTCRLAYTKSTKTKVGYWTATIALSKGTWRNLWAVDGVDNVIHKSPGILVTVPVALLVGDDAFAVEKQLHYIATPNKTGTAK